MKTHSLPNRDSTLWAIVLAWGLYLAGAAQCGAQGFQAGSVVTTNFSFGNRYQWTNDNGQVFTPNTSSFRLSDFDGKIVFFVFFDVW